MSIASYHHPSAVLAKLRLPTHTSSSPNGASHPVAWARGYAWTTRKPATFSPASMSMADRLRPWSPETPSEDYLLLLDRTARQLIAGKRARTPVDKSKNCFQAIDEIEYNRSLKTKNPSPPPAKRFHPNRPMSTCCGRDARPTTTPIRHCFAVKLSDSFRGCILCSRRKQCLFRTTILLNGYWPFSRYVLVPQFSRQRRDCVESFRFSLGYVVCCEQPSKISGSHSLPKP